MTNPSNIAQQAQTRAVEVVAGPTLGPVVNFAVALFSALRDMGPVRPQKPQRARVTIIDTTATEVRRGAKR